MVIRFRAITSADEGESFFVQGALGVQFADDAGSSQTEFALRENIHEVVGRVGADPARMGIKVNK